MALFAIGGRAARAALFPTPRQTSGPYYPDTPPVETDADLASFADGRAEGRILRLSGAIFDRNGTPIRGARVEIWQCDARGIYRHPRDRQNGRDPHFQGYGAVRSDAGGGFRFRTIVPVPYGSRTPHIHMAVTAPDGRVLVTQLYLHDHPGNGRDFLYRRLNAAERDAVGLHPVPADGIESGAFAAEIDVILAS